MDMIIYRALRTISLKQKKEQSIWRSDMKGSVSKRILTLLLCLTMVGTMFLASCGKQEEEWEEPPAPPSNSLTGETAEDGYDESASDRRIAAFVVENAPDARPQWGMDDENYSPDIVIQGEVEGGITRTLWLYADYNKLPSQIGPMRSARPPFIRFSELFDSIFIHWGMSHSKGDYVGASTVFKKDNVDHINQMTYDDQVGLYDRDFSRNVSSEHTGIVYGDKVAAAIEDEGFRTTPKEYTKLCFRNTDEPLSDTDATKIGVRYSDRSFEDTYWQYNEEDEKYHTSDFENDFARDNLLILYDDTEYITKYDYQGGGGGAVTYCDYKLAGGKGQLFSKGKVKDIEWEVEDGKLILKDPSLSVSSMEEIEAIQERNKELARQALEEAEGTADESAEAEAEAESGDADAAEGEEAGEITQNEKIFLVIPEAEDGEEELTDEDIVAGTYALQPLNKGKTWIGWVSRNNDGSVSVS